MLTEASTKKRASLHVVRGEAALAEHDPRRARGARRDRSTRSARACAPRTTRSSARSPIRTSSRGIGNAYSDEILHRARLSPVTLTSQRSTTTRSRACTTRRARRSSSGPTRLREEVGEGFPEKVTAFRPEMAVHGRYRKPCPVCGAPVQRIVLRRRTRPTTAPRCQTGGKLLADRALSRLLKKDWPQIARGARGAAAPPEAGAGTDRSRLVATRSPRRSASSRSTSTARCSTRTELHAAVRARWRGLSAASCGGAVHGRDASAPRCPTRRRSGSRARSSSTTARS